MTATVENINKEVDYEERMKRARGLTNQLLSNNVNNYYLLKLGADSIYHNVDSEEKEGPLTLLYLLVSEIDKNIQPLNELLECFPEPSK